MDNKYVDVFPDKIKLSKIFEQDYYEARITLTNLTNSYVVFKVYINKNTIYSANPSSSYIKPRESTTINVKRLEKVKLLYLNNKEAQNEVKQASDKFLIIAVPTNSVINSISEAKAIMTESTMKSKSNQEIFLFVEYDNKLSEFPLRNTIANVQSANLRNFDSNKNPFGKETVMGSNTTSIECELEETNKLIEETKKKIQQMESQISILENQLNNYGKYSNLYQRKSKGIRKYFIFSVV